MSAVPIRRVAAAALVLALAACARTPAPAPPAAAAIVKPGPGKTPQTSSARPPGIQQVGNSQTPPPEPAVHRKPAPPRPAPPPTPAPPPPPAAAAAAAAENGWARMVRKGTLETSEEGRLVFRSASVETVKTSGSLFEDAIILNAVRASLRKSAARQGDAAAPDVRVREGEVYLRLPREFDPSASASAVDAALETAGVRKVIVESAP